MDIKIRPLTIDDLEAVRVFTDKWIGENYFSLEELERIYSWSQMGDSSASFLAMDGDIIAGARLTYAPGQWINPETRGLTPDNWNVPKEKAAYFKSLFVSGDYQQKGIGKNLSDTSIRILREMGAEAILCHSWLESPGNSSQKYLQKMGFEGVCEHKKFWFPIDYECTRCSPDRCICTAMEMIKYLKED
ncbi:MAG: GNAT family N-acetyltransferase [Bacteriovoracaceae bacterium]|nr:GNAT family N-acetyltransferase [Bacteriovoracaceae bacterium]